MKRKPVRLTSRQRQIAVDAVVTALTFHGIEVIAVALDSSHLHVLARFRDHKPRKWLGIAKKNAARALSDQQLVPEGGVWGKHSECEPIKDRKHQIAVVRYTLRHARKGATTWYLNKPHDPHEQHIKPTSRATAWFSRHSYRVAG